MKKGKLNMVRLALLDLTEIGLLCLVKLKSNGLLWALQN